MDQQKEREEVIIASLKRNREAFVSLFRRLQQETVEDISPSTFSTIADHLERL